MTDIELAVQDLAGIGAAADLGVTRIELCGALSLGGLTPSAALISRAAACVPTHVLVRPRAGGFQYTPEECDLIVAEIHSAADAGAHGVVVGALDAGAMPDLRAMERFIHAAGDLQVTFHRAIDVAADIPKAALSLVDVGVDRILTSGGARSAEAGRERLRDLVGLCGLQIEIQAGAGINPANVRSIAGVGVAAVHFSAKRTIVPGPPPSGPALSGGTVDFGGYDTVDLALAAATIRALKE